MKQKLVIFGSGDIAELAHYYFTNDSDYTVSAFTVDASHLSSDTYLGLPVVSYEKLHEHYPPTEYTLFIALSYSKLNQVRKDRYINAKQRGYELASYISSKASILNDEIGDNCFILEDNTVQPFVKIGNNITLWSGNHIGHHSIISDHTFIASHVVVSGGVTIGEQCFIGVNATLRDHIKIGDKNIIGAGALILESTASDKLFIGNKTTAVDKKSFEIKKI